MDILFPPYQLHSRVLCKGLVIAGLASSSQVQTSFLQFVLVSTRVSGGGFISSSPPYVCP